MLVKWSQVLRFAIVAGLVALLIASSGAFAEDPALEGPVIKDAARGLTGPQHPVSARILTRVHGNGTVELCLLTERLQVLCPEARFLRPALASRDRWIPSSEVSWELSVVSGRIVRPPSLLPDDQIEADRTPVHGESDTDAATRLSCQPNFEDMLASTWKVQTSRSRGSAFYIGDGRFITAHHVIDGTPPFVTLTQGDRAIPAAVLGFDSSVDMALLGVFDREAVADLPVAELRVPDRQDVGSDVYLVGYPGGGSLTVSFGGIVSRVWEDEIQTTSASAGGNSGGPMFDACGDVLGVLWASSSSRNFSHSGEVLSRKLAELEPVWPALPTSVPQALAFLDDVLIWHYGAQPPEHVDCSTLEADIWIGAFGVSLSSWELAERVGLTHAGDCAWNSIWVAGFVEPTPTASEPTEGISDSSPGYPDSCRPSRLVKKKNVETVVHRSIEDFGTATFTSLNLTTDCPLKFNYRLVIEFDPPLERPYGSVETLIDINGARLEGPWQGGRYQTEGSGIEAPTNTVFQSWEVPDDFVPVAIEVRTGKGDKWTFDLNSPAPEGPFFVQSLNIAAMVDSETGTVMVCPRSPDRTLLCAQPVDISTSAERGGRWQVSEPFEWMAVLPEVIPHKGEDGVQVSSIRVHCGLNRDIGLMSWQVSSVSADATAVYVGNGQFLVNASIVSDELPWVVVSQSERSYPAVRVAEDARNGLALVEVMGESRRDFVGRPLRFAAVTDDLESASVWLVGYPSGDPNRFTVGVGEAESATDRILRFPAGGGWYRDGAPAIDPCTQRALGISLGFNLILRAEVVQQSLTKLRRERQAPSLPQTGPPIHGSVALWLYPVYVGTEQPDFGGWICNVRESQRYDIYYAIYMARSSSLMLRQIREGEFDWVRTCRWSGKIFIVEYRSDREPELICAAPSKPNHPLSDIAVEFTAPEGIDLLQIARFEREPCGDVEFEEEWQDDWSSDFFLSIRVTTDIELDDIFVEYFDLEGQKLRTRSQRIGDVDPDVLSHIVNLHGEPSLSKIVVRVSEPSQ